MHTLFWRDMLGIGTAVNLVATFVALTLASQGGAAWVTAVIHFAPLPYNIFLFAAVNRGKPRSRLASALAFVWLALMTIV